MMVRTDCLKEIAAHRGDALVVAVYSSAFDWIQISPHPLNFLAVGAMGQASSSALGFALGLPDRKIMVLDGDGSLLMNLGSLATIAGVGPKNLIHFVCQNGCYEANGEHPIPAQGSVSFSQFARGAGYKNVVEFSYISALRAQLPELISTPGPTFVSLIIKASSKPDLDYELVHGDAAREKFRSALAAELKGGRRI
jgi:sulfopyruvate decarboxylase subunit beta